MSNAEEWVTPRVSNANGYKMQVTGKSAYLESFLFAAASSALADWDDKWTYESARVLTIVTSQVNGLLRTKSAPPGACRQSLSGGFWPHGSLVTHWYVGRCQVRDIVSLIA